MTVKFQTIIFCGLDGAGKSTQANKILDYLTNKKIKSKYVWLRYPNRLSIPFAILLRIFGFSGYPLPEKRQIKGIKNLSGHYTLQKIWKQFLLLDFKFVSSYKIFRPISCGNLIILDRFVLDALIEFTILCGKKSISELARNDFLNILPKKSKILFLDIDPNTSYERNHEEDLETLKLKRRLYLELFEHVDVDIINCNQSIEEIHKKIKERLNIF